MYILESVVVAHEVVHSLHKSKEPRVIILKVRGFSDAWIRSPLLFNLVGDVLTKMIKKLLRRAMHVRGMLEGFV
jgi:hypothetical protein